MKNSLENRPRARPRQSEEYDDKKEDEGRKVFIERGAAYAA